MLAVALGTLAVKTQAQNVISWNFNANSTVNPTDTAGVVPAIHWTDTWLNNVTANLPDNQGNATTLSFDMTQTGGSSDWYLCHGYGPTAMSWSIGSHPGYDSDGTANKEMLNGYLNDGISSWGCTITNSFAALIGIPYSQYDIYVYFSADVAGRSGDARIGDTAYYFTTLGPAEVSGGNALFTQATQTFDAGGSNPAADYAVFSGLTGSSQTILLQMGVTDAWAGIAGFQIVAVPEPGTLALGVLGGVMLVLDRHSKKS